MIAVKAENISKAYQLGQISTGTLSRDIERWYSQIRGKENPLLRVGEIEKYSNRNNQNILWSLKDIDFEIEQGESVGIIGRNGAGKSTLLKVLSRITSPTSGRITGKGRIASLLEVGTGFHPELSGRENIFLNGAILGMRKKEISRKFDEIVDFAGVERFIDTPVKRYSSGMYVRLAFSVAAHLESEILLVDEVLAVGDAEFQKKCLGKMGEVSHNQGRTILFVSHHMASIKAFCSRAIVLNQGKLIADNDVNTAINQYNELAFTHCGNIREKLNIKNTNISIHHIKINGFDLNEVELNDQNQYVLNIEIFGNARIPTKIALECRFYDEYGTSLAFFSPGHYKGIVRTYEGEFQIAHAVAFPEQLNQIPMYMSLYLTDPGSDYIAIAERVLKVTHDGYPMHNGFKFSYAKGAGLLFLKETQFNSSN